MKISNVHLNSPVEVRFTAEHQGVTKVRFVHFAPGDSALTVAELMAANINHFVELVEAGAFKPFNVEEHVAGILADARRYGTD